MWIYKKRRRTNLSIGLNCITGSSVRTAASRLKGASSVQALSAFAGLVQRIDLIAYYTAVTARLFHMHSMDQRQGRKVACFAHAATGLLTVVDVACAPQATLLPFTC